MLTINVEKSSRWVELQALARLFAEKIQVFDLVFIEEPPFVNNKRTFLALGQTSGALLAASPGRSYLVPVDAWKKATVGRGGAPKDLVATWLALQHPELHELCAGDQNLVDATCIALYGKSLIEEAGEDS